MYKQQQVKTTAENTFVKSLLALNPTNLTQCDFFLSVWPDYKG